MKVYGLQNFTTKIIEELKKLTPKKEQELNSWFIKIIQEGTEKFDLSHNENWLETTRPIVEAFFHDHYFLKMAVKYGKELDSPPNPLPSGWAAVLYLYGLR